MSLGRDFGHRIRHALMQGLTSQGLQPVNRHAEFVRHVTLVTHDIEYRRRRQQKGNRRHDGKLSWTSWKPAF